MRTALALSALFLVTACNGFGDLWKNQASNPCPQGEVPFNCWFDVAAGDKVIRSTAAICAENANQALDRAFLSVGCPDSVTAKSCTPAPMDPGSKPNTVSGGAGGAPPSQCSGPGSSASSAGGSPACGLEGDVCDDNLNGADCCSGSCTLSVCN